MTKLCYLTHSVLVVITTSLFFVANVLDRRQNYGTKLSVPSVLAIYESLVLGVFYRPQKDDYLL